MSSPILPIRPGISPLAPSAAAPIGMSDSDAPFGDLLKRALGDVTGMQDRKEDMIGAFLRGEPVELHQVMAAAEEASLSLELLVETRNKLTDAYRSIMNMQV